MRDHESDAAAFDQTRPARPPQVHAPPAGETVVRADAATEPVGGSTGTMPVPLPGDVPPQSSSLPPMPTGPRGAGPAPAGSPATVGRRIAGWWADVGLALLVQLPLFIGYGLTTASAFDGDDARAATGLVLTVVGAVLALGFGLLQWGLMARGGVTLGRRIAGYRLVDESTGAPPGWMRALGYYLLLTAVVNFTCGIGAIVLAAMASGDPERRTFVDRAVRLRSTVMRERGFVAPAILLPVAGATLAMAAMMLPLLVIDGDDAFGGDYYSADSDPGYTDETDSGTSTAMESPEATLPPTTPDESQYDGADAQETNVVVSNTCGRPGEAGYCELNERSTPDTSTDDYREFDEGDTLVAECLTDGESVRSEALDRTSSTWARLDDGGYVAAIFLRDDEGAMVIDAGDLPTC